MSDDIKHSRTCPECGATTFAWERCHECGDCHWKDDDPDRFRGRVTIDLDGYLPNFEMAAIRAYHNLADVADRVDVDISSSGQGIHLTGWFEQRITFAERVTMRRTFGDDGRRVEFDVERHLNGVYNGVLWSEKHRDTGAETAPEHRPGKDRDFDDIHDALTHMQMTSSDPHDKMQRLAEHGHRAEPSLARRAGQ